MNNRIVLAGVAVLAIAFAGHRFFLTGRAETPERHGAPLVNVTVPALSGVAAEGKSLFDANCATCHGENAAGKDGYGPPLIHPIYRPGHHADASFYMAAQNGARSHHWTFGDMPPVEGVDRADVGKIIAYVRTLQQANGVN